MKKLFSLISGVIATLVATPAIAQLPYDCGQWDATEFGYGLNPPIYCPLNNCFGNIGVYADFVYFRPSEDEIFAYTVSSYFTETVPSTPDGVLSTENFYRRKFDPNFKPGYRVGVLYQLPCDTWTIDANYTYYFSKTTKRSPVGVFTDSFVQDDVTAADPFDNNGIVIGLPASLNLFEQDFVFGELRTQVGSTWKLRYNLVDVDLTREFFVGPAVTFRPYFGFRGLFIQQHLDSRGIKDFTTSTPLTFNSYKSVLTQNLVCNSDGYGVHGGSEVNFILCDGLSLFGNVGIHLLWTHYNTQFNRLQVVSNLQDEINQTIVVPHNKESFDVMRFGADLQGGVQWATLFNCNQNEFFVRFAWEHHIYVSQNSFRTYLDGESDFQDNTLGGLLATPGDLALYGFSVGAGFTF